MRQWMKTSPLNNNKEQLRESILSTAMKKVKTEREKNILKLRNGQHNFNQLAMEILSVTMSNGYDSSPEKSKWMNNSNYCEGNFYQKHSEIANVEDSAMMQFLGSEEHDLLMEQIAEALKLEYEDEMLEVCCNEDVLRDIDWSQLEEDAREDKSVICPVCRSSTLEIIDCTGICLCGCNIMLHDEETGYTYNARDLTEKLAAIFDRHLLMCECDGNLSPLPLGSHKNKKKNTLNGFENVIEFEAEYNEMEISDSPSKRNIHQGNLEFYQKDQRTLDAYCLYCGFNEKVL